MNCENCGAPMTVFSNLGYFYCEYCGSFHIPAKTEEGITILDQAQDQLDCPVCDQPLFRARIDWHPAYYCKNCQGVLTQQSAFGELVKYRRAKATGPPAPPVPLNQGELERQVGCPLCSQAMSTHPYYGPGNIVIDTCPHCRVIWLDYGELGQVIDAPGRDRGSFLKDRLGFYEDN